MKVIIGFTGTSRGMNKKQMCEVRMHLQDKFHPGVTFVHGDCIGADTEAAEIAEQIGYRLYSMPSNVMGMRAFTPSDWESVEKDPLARNKDIVDKSQFMIAAPRTNYRVIRSGTWYTVRYAESVDKPIIFCYPF